MWTGNFLGYGHEYRKALHDYTLIGGKQPMPPLFVLGYWYSKYQRYSQQDFVEYRHRHKEKPHSYRCYDLDMDWHTEGWTGWTWNKELIPDPQGLLRWMHGQGLKVSMNLHPADGVDSDEENFSLLAKDMGMDPATAKVVPWQLESPLFYKNMFKDIIHHREKDGVDFWWLDWQQNLTNPRMDGLSETFWCNHVFYNDMRITHPELRPLIFHRWGGLGKPPLSYRILRRLVLNFPHTRLPAVFHRDCGKRLLRLLGTRPRRPSARQQRSGAVSQVDAATACSHRCSGLTPLTTLR